MIQLVMQLLTSSLALRRPPSTCLTMPSPKHLTSRGFRFTLQLHNIRLLYRPKKRNQISPLGHSVSPNTSSPRDCLFYYHSKISVVQSNRSYDLKNFVILQGHRYLESPILGVQRRRVKCQHPNSQPPHTSNSVRNCASSPTTTLQ